MKVVENSPQNARNCTIFKNFLGGACPQTPLAKARSFAARDMPLRGMYILNPRNFKVGPPPLRNPAYAPAFVYPYFIYGVEIWGNAYNVYIDPLIKLQKKVSKNYYIFELFRTYRTVISKTRNFKF